MAQLTDTSIYLSHSSHTYRSMFLKCSSMKRSPQCQMILCI